ncbi:MAG TPA: DUF3090 family protein [Actinomycetota bacterium]
MLIELDPVDRLTADAVGPPGSRTFYLQGRKGDELVTLVVEKQQVQLLAASVVEILSRIGKETGQGPADEAMQLEEPIVPSWRAGRLSIGYQEERDLLLLEVEEATEEDEDEDEADEAEAGGAEVEAETEIDPQLIEELERTVADMEAADETEAKERVRFWATREQMLSLARHGAAVCARGRPRCQFCGNPLDPEGHVCPAMNGHSKSD